MKVYAAWSGPDQQAERLGEQPPARVLVSFAYDRRGELLDRLLRYIDVADVDLMLDSGAFSVWTKGETVDLDEYIGWASRYWEQVGRQAVIVNLDVIPGGPRGGAPTTRQRNKAVRESMSNADRIRAAGLPVCEVYHLHEPVPVFDQLLDRRQPGELVALGGLAGKGDRAAKVAFCDTAFGRLRDRGGGWDRIGRLHGLGISPDAPLCTRYPWWSVDSSSWSIFDRFGAEVSRAGRRQKPNPQKRLANERGITAFRPASDLYYARVVRRWRRLEADLTRLWQHRGVTFDEEAIPA